MPKATVDEDGRSTGREDDVGLSRQIATMKPEPVSMTVQELSDS
jgi:hypothetical protein